MFSLFLLWLKRASLNTFGPHNGQWKWKSENVKKKKMAQKCATFMCNLKRKMKKIYSINQNCLFVHCSYRLDDHIQRFGFAEWSLEQLGSKPHFRLKLVTTADAYFWING